MAVNNYHEFEFTASDLDSGDSLTDVICLKDCSEETEAFDIIQKYVDTRHPITTLSGNTWEIESVEKTGLSYQRNSETKERIVLTTRDESYQENEYPLMNSY